MVQIETIYRAAIDNRGIVKTRKCRNRSRPFFDGVVQQRLSAELRKLVRHLLRRRCGLQDDTDFVREMHWIRLETPHHGIDTVGMKHKTI